MASLADSYIYSEFSDYIQWIGEKHQSELLSLPKEILPLARYYLEKRLIILQHKPVKIDSRLGRPFPYLVFWFSDALGLNDKRIIRNLALSLSYISLSVSIRDDLADGRIRLENRLASEHAHISLSNLYYSKYFRIFVEIIHPKSFFWHILSQSLNQWYEYETWSYLFSAPRNFNPLSRHFLKRSSQYLLAITLPTIAAIAIVTKRESKIAAIVRFLTNYWSGWKIVDDIRDWSYDLSIAKYNHSSVLYYAQTKLDKNVRLTPEIVSSMFLSKEFVTALFVSILRFYKASKRDAIVFRSHQLDRFIDDQLEFHTDEMRLLLQLRRNFSNSLLDILMRNPNKPREETK